MEAVVADSDESSNPFDIEKPLGELLDELRKVEGSRPFVGLKWFRDQVLPAAATNGHAIQAHSIFCCITQPTNA